MGGSLTRFTCPDCNKRGHFNLTLIGDRFVCPKCAQAGTFTLDSMSRCSSSYRTSARAIAPQKSCDPIGIRGITFFSGDKSIAAPATGGA